MYFKDTILQENPTNFFFKANSYNSNKFLKKFLSKNPPAEFSGIEQILDDTVKEFRDYVGSSKALTNAFSQYGGYSGGKSSKKNEYSAKLYAGTNPNIKNNALNTIHSNLVKNGFKQTLNQSLLSKMIDSSYAWYKYSSDKKHIFLAYASIDTMERFTIYIIVACLDATDELIAMTENAVFKTNYTLTEATVEIGKYDVERLSKLADKAAKEFADKIVSTAFKNEFDTWKDDADDTYNGGRNFYTCYIGGIDKEFSHNEETAIINSVKQYYKSIGIKDIEVSTSGSINVDGKNSSKYPELWFAFFMQDGFCAFQTGTNDSYVRKDGKSW